MRASTEYDFWDQLLERLEEQNKILAEISATLKRGLK